MLFSLLHRLCEQYFSDMKSIFFLKLQVNQLITIIILRSFVQLAWFWLRHFSVWRSASHWRSIPFCCVLHMKTWHGDILPICLCLQQPLGFNQYHFQADLILAVFKADHPLCKSKKKKITTICVWIEKFHWKRIYKHAYSYKYQLEWY